MGANLYVTCNCGQAIPVTAGMAGSEVTCECGERVCVPPLRLLRQELSADAADSTDPIAAIRTALEHHRPPAGTNCILCQTPTDHSIECDLDGWQHGPQDPTVAWLTRRLRGLFQRTGSPTASDRNASPIRVPVRICPGCFRRAGDLERHGAVKKIINRAALYRQVHTLYPKAQFRFVKSSDNS